jgi:hypothetical protein
MKEAVITVKYRFLADHSSVQIWPTRVAQLQAPSKAISSEISKIDNIPDVHQEVQMGFGCLVVLPRQTTRSAKRILIFTRWETRRQALSSPPFKYSKP